MKDKKLKSDILTARIEPQIHDKLKRLSKKTNLSKSWYICQALEKQMPEFERMANEAA